jgi:hypothetical protein
VDAFPIKVYLKHYPMQQSASLVALSRDFKITIFAFGDRFYDDINVLYGAMTSNMTPPLLQQNQHKKEVRVSPRMDLRADFGEN